MDVKIRSQKMNYIYKVDAVNQRFLLESARDMKR